MAEDLDLALALQIQAEYDEENSQQERLPPIRTSGSPEHKQLSPVDPQWETLDPSPDVRALFLEFNTRYFWGKLDMVEVRWSPRMTLCAGLCVYERRGGLCSVRLSEPLLKLRPRKDLVETLLHEMIHALLFVTQNNKDHDGHGPEFQKHMNRINKDCGSNISIYHTFHDEVDNYRTHWWKCNGPCQKRPPYFGMVKRAMNRPPSPRDPWWGEHQRSCGGTYTKVKEPEGYGQKKSKAKVNKNDKPIKSSPDIRNFVNGAKAASKKESGGGDKDKNNKKKKGGGIQVFSGSGEDNSQNSQSSGASNGNVVQPSWKPGAANATTFRDLDSDSDWAEKKQKEIDLFSGSGKKLGSSSSTSAAGGSAGSATANGGERQVITRRIPGIGIITSERYTSPTKQSNVNGFGGSPTKNPGSISSGGASNIPTDTPNSNGRGNTSTTTPSNGFGSDRKRKSLPIDLDVSDSEDYLPKAKQHKRSDSVEFTVNTPPGSLVSVPGFRSVCTGHSSDRRHMNSVAIDHAKRNKANSKSADGKGVKGKNRIPVKDSDKKRPKRISNVNNYAADRNNRVLVDSSDSNSDDEEFAPLISASHKKTSDSQKKERDSDPDWNLDSKHSKPNRISLDTDSDNDSLILEDPKISPQKKLFQDEPMDFQESPFKSNPYKSKISNSPVSPPLPVSQPDFLAGASAFESPGAPSASNFSENHSQELVDCPSCTARLPMSQINAHLDSCLA